MLSDDPSASAAPSSAELLVDGADDDVFKDSFGCRTGCPTALLNCCPEESAWSNAGGCKEPNAGILGLAGLSSAESKGPPIPLIWHCKNGVLMGVVECHLEAGDCLPALPLIMASAEQGVHPAAIGVSWLLPAQQSKHHSAGDNMQQCQRW